MERLLIIDGHSYAYRAFHAIRELSSPSGQPTNAIYGFLKMLADEAAYKALLDGKSAHEIATVWEDELAEFEKLRKKYLIYP